MNNTINQQIEIIVDDKLQRDIAFPTIVTITRVYADGYVNAKNEIYGELKYVPTIVPHSVGDKTLLVFANNNYSDRIVI